MGRASRFRTGSVLVSVVVLASAVLMTGVASSSEDEDLSRCGAVTLENRPPLGGGGFDVRPYQRRHNRWLKEHPKVFASGYLSGKRFYVGFTHDVCDNLQRFLRGLDNPWRVKAFKADWTYRQLRRAQRCVSDLFDKRWLKISATGTDVWRNKLEVMLEENTERRRNYIRNQCGTVSIRFVEGTVTPD